MCYSACFEYFRERSDLRIAIEENKQILKEKMAQAQVLGERANQSRLVVVLFIVDVVVKEAKTVDLLKEYH